jgi:preprotein translocase subunit SecE
VQKEVKNVATVQSKPTLWNKITKFLREVRSEMRKVSWPNRKELITYTIVVLVTVVIVAAFTGLVDVIVTAVLNLLSQLGR